MSATVQEMKSERDAIICKIGELIFSFEEKYNVCLRIQSVTENSMTNKVKTVYFETELIV